MRCRLLLFALLIALLCGLSARAGEQLLVVTEDFPPYNYEENDQIKGTATELVRAVLQKAGVEYELVIMPWKRAMQTAEFQPGTLIFSMTRTPERESRFLWLLPVAENSFNLYCRKDRADLLRMDAASIRRHATICIRDGTSARSMLLGDGFLERNFISLTDQDGSRCLSMVAGGRVDFSPGTPRTQEMRIAKLGLEGIFVAHPNITIVEQMYLAANLKTDPAVLKRIGKAYRTLIDSGVIERMHAAKPQ